MVDNIFKENDNSDIPLVKKLSAFYLSKGKASFYFLCHAALPLFFRLDWLYYLWANFRHDIRTNTQQDVPYHAIADVLQTPFLATIGIELFEMEQGVRDFLLYELEQAFGRAHTEKLASFLQQYAQQCVQQGYERDAHLQSALIIRNPNEAAIHIGKALQKAQENQQTQEINRLLHVAQSLGSAVEDKQKGTFIKYEQLASLRYDIQQESKPNAQRYPKLSEKPSKNSMPVEVPADYLGEVQVVEKPAKKLKRIIIQQAPQAQVNSQQQQQNNPFLSENISTQKKLSFSPQDFTNTDEIILPAETESLDLSGILVDNSIKEIAQLTGLAYLKLSGMELSELTFLDALQASGGTFEKLEVLDISNNQLTEFKVEYLDLIPNIKELNTDNEMKMKEIAVRKAMNELNYAKIPEFYEIIDKIKLPKRWMFESNLIKLKFIYLNEENYHIVLNNLIDYSHKLLNLFIHNIEDIFLYDYKIKNEIIENAINKLEQSDFQYHFLEMDRIAKDVEKSQEYERLKMILLEEVNDNFDWLGYYDKLVVFSKKIDSHHSIWVEKNDNKKLLKILEYVSKIQIHDYFKEIEKLNIAPHEEHIKNNLKQFYIENNHIPFYYYQQLYVFAQLVFTDYETPPPKIQNPMSYQTHALLIAIDTYAVARHLRGCVNDINAVEDYLKTQYRDISITTLKNQEATREAIIKAFEDLAGKAEVGDTVCIHFSGHGSTEVAPPEFGDKHQNETILCYDSRSGGVPDLADKEIAVLIDKFKRGTHIVLCLDSCHSGGGSRNQKNSRLTQKRHESQSSQTRSLESYAGGYYSQQVAEVGKVQVPEAPHIILSACASREEAWETDQQRGLFTTVYLETLAEVGKYVSYAELFEKIQIKIRTTDTEKPQTPQIEAIGGGSVYQQFLTGKALQEVQASYNVCFNPTKNTWEIKAGALQGFLPTAQASASVGIYEADLSERIAQAEITVAQLEWSTLQLNHENAQALDKTKTYQGILISATSLVMRLYHNLPAQDYEMIVPQGYYVPESEEIKADYVLWKDDKTNIYTLSHQKTQKVIEETDERDKVRNLLLKVARWENIRLLENPQTELNPKEIEISLEVFENDVWRMATIPGDKMLDFYLPKTANGFNLPYRLRASNQTSQPLHFAFVFVSPLYGIFKVANVEVPAQTNDQKLYFDEKTGMVFLKGQEQDNESNCLFKFLISTSHINVDLITQKDFSINFAKGSRFGDSPEITKETIDVKGLENDWTTQDLFINLYRQKSENTLSPNKSVKLNQLTIESNNEVSANISFSSVENNARGVRSTAGKVWEAWVTESSERISIAPRTRGSVAQDIITLSNIKGKVSEANPLKITLPNLPTDGADEVIVPMALCGDILIPIGFSREDAPNVIEITQIPDLPAQSRSFERAIGFCLHKITAKVFGEKVSDVFKLRAVEYTSEGKPLYTDDMTDIRGKVQASENILLVVHGILGNTTEIAEFAHKLTQAGKFDLVLAYDYENLHEPIEDTAMRLKRRLLGGASPFKDEEAQQGAGISAEKKITILAHSMGGLVSRYMIEQLEGQNFVKKLVMCGTPNAGSLFAKLESNRKIATQVLSIGSIIGGYFFPPAKAVAWVGWLLFGAKHLKTALGSGATFTNTLAQMDKQSGFLGKLNENERNGTNPVRYVIVAGNVLEYMPPKRSIWGTFKEEMTIGFGDWLQGNAPHDIAVLVEDIKDAGKNTPVAVYDVPCHHLNYFTQDDSVKVLLEIFG